jgi:GrpB-like predicted nucleotidyltransferase (UPF0157 family)
MPSTLGLASGQLQLIAHDPGWKGCFLDEQARLHAALGPLVLDIQHVGSTAVAGLIAKPILDLAIAVRSFEDAAATIPVMERLGYESRGEAGIARRRFFVKGQPRTHHVHLLEQHSAAWRDHLLFRDTLIADPQALQAYAALKSELAAQLGGDRDAYQAGKESFITGVLQRARAAAVR